MDPQEKNKTINPNNSNTNNNSGQSPLISPLRTFESDIANALKHSDASVVKVAIAEQEAQRKRAAEILSRENTSNGPIQRPQIPNIPKEIPIEKVEKTFIPNPAGVSVPPPGYAPAPKVSESQIPIEAFRVMPKPDQIQNNPKQNPYASSATPRFESKAEPDYSSDFSEDFSSPTKTFPWKNILLILLAIGFLGGGGYGLYYLYSNRPKADTPATLTEQINTIIPVSSNKKMVTASSTTSISKLLVDTLKEQSGSKGTLTNIYFRFSNDFRSGGSDISALNFISLVGLTNVPDALVRALRAPFMFGYYSGENRNEPFAIFQVDFFQGALASMIRYEQSMEQDFTPLFIPLADNSLATTTFNINATSFSDIIIKNKDVRVMKRRSGQTVLLYSFIDSKTLVITTSNASFEAIVDSINNQKFVR
ncbi:MAG: hypothetical protein WCP15_00365 [bacterium]